MSNDHPNKTSRSQLIQELVAQGHLIPSGERGVYGRGRICETIYSRIDALISNFSIGDQPEVMRFPPLVPRRLLDAVGYTSNFPHLCGVVVSVNTAAIQGTQPEFPGPSFEYEHTKLALLPAACYPAYPALASRGTLPSDGVTLDLGPTCVFRNEPSDDPARFQVFHQRELVKMGTEMQVLRWRDQWMKRAAAMYDQLELNTTFVVAADPFFGRGGRLLAQNQRDDRLKYEAITQIAQSPQVAISSFNYHRDQMGRAFGLTCVEGKVAHTACVGFGLERITIAMFDRHGYDPQQWPIGLRQLLKLETPYA